MSKTIQCSKGCCQLKVGPYQPISIHRTPRKKAGVFIYNPAKNQVLLVLSRNRFWGLPKGSVQTGETDTECAIREVFEETGYVVQAKQFLYSIKVNTTSTYFYMELAVEQQKDKDDIQNNSQQEANDVNGIGWVDLDCLVEMVAMDKVKLNKQGKVAFQKIKGIFV